MAQIRHFLDFEVAEKAMEVAIVTLFTTEVQTDEDCGLSWVDTSNKENKAFQLAMFCGCLILTMCRMLLILFND